MNLSQLYYFRKLADLQHYAKAAKELYITQPSLSNAISSLENELGVSLFQRTGRNIQLTKCGQEFLDYVEAGLDRIDKGVDIMKEYAGTSEGGKVDLGCIITVQTDYVPRLITRFKFETGTSATFNVREDPSLPLMHDLKDGIYDVIFASKSDTDPLLSYTPILTQQVIVAMNSSSPLAKKEYIVPEDLRGHSLISYSDTIPLGKAVKEMLDKLNVGRINYNYLDESILAGFAMHGVEAAVMLDTFFLKSVDGIEVRPLVNNLKEKKTFHHRIYMIHDQRNYHPRCVDHFIDYVVESHSLKEDPSKIYID
ncbi:MAG: LysR family transcriptional regulator [Raoultibacter sp.]|jgi:DNA-binding transcriptional LysR family regulator